MNRRARAVRLRGGRSIYLCNACRAIWVRGVWRLGADREKKRRLRRDSGGGGTHALAHQLPFVQTRY